MSKKVYILLSILAVSFTAFFSIAAFTYSKVKFYDEAAKSILNNNFKKRFVPMKVLENYSKLGWEVVYHYRDSILKFYPWWNNDNANIDFSNKITFLRIKKLLPIYKDFVLILKDRNKKIKVVMYNNIWPKLTQKKIFENLSNVKIFAVERIKNNFYKIRTKEGLGLIYKNIVITSNLKDDFQSLFDVLKTIK